MWNDWDEQWNDLCRSAAVLHLSAQSCLLQQHGQCRFQLDHGDHPQWRYHQYIPAPPAVRSDGQLPLPPGPQFVSPILVDSNLTVIWLDWTGSFAINGYLREFSVTESQLRVYSGFYSHLHIPRTSQKSEPHIQNHVGSVSMLLRPFIRPLDSRAESCLSPKPVLCSSPSVSALCSSVIPGDLYHQQWQCHYPYGQIQPCLRNR